MFSRLNDAVESFFDCIEEAVKEVIRERGEITNEQTNRKTTAQKIFKSMIDLNLDKDEVIYFEEFINLLYEAGLLNPIFRSIRIH